MNPTSESVTPNLGLQSDNEPGLFHCKICSKAFAKKPSRNRHVLYCRKKLGDNLPTTRKSCAACRKAKLKCDSQVVESCSRCIKRGLVCMYELTRRSENLTQQPTASTPDESKYESRRLVKSSKDPDPQETFLDTSLDYDNLIPPNSSIDNSGSLALPPVLPDFAHENFTSAWEPETGYTEEELDNADFNVDAELDFDISGNDFSLDCFPSHPLPILNPEIFFTPEDCMFHTPYLALRPMDLDHPYNHKSLVSPRSPFIHSNPLNGSQIGRTFIMQNIQSYVLSLTASNLPPFIHPVCLPNQGPSIPSSAPLEICKSIISLYANKTTSTSLFIWRSISAESDRFMEEFVHADDWTILSMLQSITLYILLRIFDQDSFSVDFDRELVRSMYNLAIKAEQYQLVCQAEVEGVRPDWKEWVLLESKRRTVTVLFILHLLFDIKPEQRAKSHVGLSVLPLPAHKQIWLAKEEEEWNKEYDEMLNTREGESYLRYQDLIDLGKGKLSGGRMRNLNSWMVTGDAFGMLVMMAATTL